MDMLEGNSREERDPELEMEEDNMIWGDMDNHWKDAVENNI